MDEHKQIHEDILPERLKEMIKSCDWQRITIGMSASRTYRLTGENGVYFLKVQSVEVDTGLFDEKERIEWLQGKLPVPKLLFYDKDEWNEYMLLSEVAGVIASDKHYETMLPQLMEQLGAGLRAVHAVDIEDCPFDRRLDTVLQEAYRRAKDGLVDEDDFDVERAGMTAVALYGQLVELRPAEEELVFTHGDYCLPNIMLDQGQISGFIDWGGAGVADKYQDIALAERSITYNFGGQYVPLFLEAYGLSEADREKMKYYKLLDEFF